MKKTIKLFEGEKMIHTVAVKANCKRASMQAAAEHKQLDALKVEFPNADKAVVEWPPVADCPPAKPYIFEYVNGKSQCLYDW